jgi:hypothetical protein
MKCSKCSGLMIQQSFFDQSLNFDGWKCVNCGKVITKKDKVIRIDPFSIFYQHQKSNIKNR